LHILKPLFRGVFVLTLINYALMFFWSMPALSEMSGGLALFDLRPGGYDLQEAKELLSALGADGRDFYLNVQQPLDLVFPVLLGLTLVLAVFLLTPTRLGWWRYPLCLAPIPGVVLDYMENAAVRLMLLSGPDDISVRSVADAAGRTLAKSILYSLAIGLVLALLALWASGKLRTKKTT